MLEGELKNNNISQEPIKKGKRDFKVLFVYPNTNTEGCMPLGIAMLSAVLRREGYQTKVFDTTFYKKSTKSVKEIAEETLEFKKADMASRGVYLDDADPIEEFRDVLNSYNPNLICVSATSTLFAMAKSLLTSVHCRAPVIIGGPHATVAPELIIKHDFIDMLCVGEGELALVELCNKLRNGQDIRNIKNLWVKEDGKIYRNSVRPLIENLDSLPFPDWEIFDDRHHFKPLVGDVYRYGQFEMSRGCPYSCTYCINRYLQRMYSGKGKYHRKKSNKRMIEEIKYFKKKYELEMLKFWDETFMVGPKKEWAKFLKIYSEEINLPFLIQTRADVMDDEKAQMLKEAGCVTVSIGIESGNQKIRNSLMDRHMTNESIINAFRAFHKAGIRTSSFNMIGLPHETREDIFETIALNKKVAPEACNIMFFYPFHGTELRDICIKNGFIPEDNIEKEVNIHEDSILQMPQISINELKGIKKTFNLYVKAPKLLYPLIRLVEGDSRVGGLIFRLLTRYYYIKSYGF